MKRLLLAAIRGYQVVSAALPAHCRFYPTCSAYAATAVTRFGVFGGLARAAWRIARCHPWHPGGHDPVPELRKRRSGRREGAVQWTST